jgi:hypothetical protein
VFRLPSHAIRQIATRDNTQHAPLARISTSRRYETHMPPTIEPTVPNEVYWEHWFSNLMAEGEANERLKREDPATYEAKMRAQLPTSQRPSAASAGAARPSRATATTPTPCATTVWRATRATGRSWCRSASASGRCEPRRPGRSATGGARTSTGRRGSAAPGRSRGRFGGTGRWTVTEGAGGICGLSRAQRACRSKLPFFPGKFSKT